MSKRSILILAIILIVVIVGGGILAYGANKGWFGSSADVISLITRSPSPSLTPSKTPTTLAKPAYGAIFGIVYQAGSPTDFKCDVFLGDGNGTGGGKRTTLGGGDKLGQFNFSELFPGSNYQVTVVCSGYYDGDTGEYGFYVGMRGPIKVEANKTTNIKIDLKFVPAP